VVEGSVSHQSRIEHGENVEIQVDLFFREAIVRGTLPVDQRRTLDIFNDRSEEVLIVRDATRLDILGELAPERIGDTRVLKRSILLAVPVDEHVFLPAILRGWWVSKQRCGAALSVGPYRLRGVVHVFRQEAVTLETVGRASSDVRMFMPVTEASAWIGGRPSSRITADTIFAARDHIDMFSFVSELTDPAVGELDRTASGRVGHAASARRMPELASDQD
jgi:hypothetical protein